MLQQLKRLLQGDPVVSERGSDHTQQEGGLQLTPEQEKWIEGYREYARTIREEALKEDLSPEAYDRLKKEFFRNNIGIDASDPKYRSQQSE